MNLRELAVERAADSVISGPLLGRTSDVFVIKERERDRRVTGLGARHCLICASLFF